MDLLGAMVLPRLIIILGIINLITGALVFFSCRCFIGDSLGKRLMKSHLFQRFNKLHCLIWRVFWSSVMVHAALAVIVFGWPR